MRSDLARRQREFQQSRHFGAASRTMSRMSRDASRDGTPAAMTARRALGASAYTPSARAGLPDVASKTNAPRVRRRRSATRWLRAMAYASVRLFHREIDHLLVPELAVPGKVTVIDFRRTVVLIAIAAVAFFIPSLPIAGVPPSLWLPFSVLAGAVALWISTGVLMIPRGAPLAMVTPFTNGVAMAVIGVMFRP